MWTWNQVFFVLGAVALGTALQTLALVGFAEIHDASYPGYRDLGQLLTWQGVRTVGWAYLAITGVGTIVMGWSAAPTGQRVGWSFLIAIVVIWALGLGATWAVSRAALYALAPETVVLMAAPGHLIGVAAIAVRVVIEGRGEE